MIDLSKYFIHFQQSIRETFKKMDVNKKNFILIVNDNGKAIGIVTDGDFRRAVWLSASLDDNIDSIMNKDFVYVNENEKDDNIIKIFDQNEKIQQVPILKRGKIVDVIFRDKFKKYKISSVRLNLPVVIMAGGEGKRLDPFTRILPKPLIPIGNEPIIKIIMDEFGKYGVEKFYISLNIKARMVKAFFHDQDLSYNIEYIDEDKQLGTAGGLKYLDGILRNPLIVSNCDVLIKINYGKILEFHEKRNNSFTLVGAIKHHTVPYGVCEIENGGALISVREKPEYDFLTNTGLYILEPDVLNLIPDDTYFNMTDLIEKVHEKGLRVGVFPISEKSWIDVGQWTEYKKAIM